MSHTELHHGDCLDVLRTMQDACVDAIVTDPPYGLSFMGRKWDYDVPATEIWEQCLRVLKPGGHLLAFAGTRTQHRMCVNIEDAGFEIRDMIAWVYGSGFPKSLDVSKAMDKAAGAERAVIERKRVKGGGMEHINRANAELHGHRSEGYQKGENVLDITAPATPEAQQWSGWGTALKPALEPITVARKPLGGTVAENVLRHGTGAINVDGCRVGTEQRFNTPASPTSASRRSRVEAGYRSDEGIGPGSKGSFVTGRWPANLIHDGSDEVVQLFPESNGSGPARQLNRGTREGEGWGMSDQPGQLRDAGTGSAARFFYTAKASKDDRDKGNTHPTVKPTDLMAYLCRLVTPPGGIVLDPFMGSGTTGKAALSEGFGFIGIERDAEYYAICKSRFNGAQIGLPLGV